MNRFTVIAVLLLLTGCSLAPLGDSDFSCPRDRYGVHCLSARAVYQATNTTDRLGAATTPAAAPAAATPSDHWGERNGDDKIPAAAAVAAPAVAANQAGRPTAPPAVPRPDDPLPLRTPAQVLRIWVAPFEDEAGNLHAPGYVFAEVVPRRWQLGEPAATLGEPVAALTPLQVEHRDPSPAAGISKGAAAPFDLLGPRQTGMSAGGGNTLGTGSSRTFNP